MLEVEGVSKTYSGGVAALQDIALTVEKGVFGLLGANGAGKSTLMRTLATLQEPDQGEIRLDGRDLLSDPQVARRRIGYLPQDMGVYPRVTAFEMLDFLAGLKGLKRKERRRQVADLLEQVNLVAVADRRLDTYSGGMRRRFGIAAAFLGAPELVIVDEPTAGLDPSERRRFQLLLAEASQDCILILSSHIVEDLAGLCNNLALMKEGRIVASGAPSTLVDALSGKIWHKNVSFNELPRFQNEYNTLSWRPQDGSLTVRVFSEQPPGDAFEPAVADLEDLYAAHVTQTIQ
ncbi:MAG: ABC transporter ATP-binding protein [Pseudomonadota bacterium]